MASAFPHHFDFNDYHPPSRTEPFDWQLPPPAASYHARPFSLNDYTELENELRDNAQRDFYPGVNMSDSIHTEFQEEAEFMPRNIRDIEGVDEYDPPPTRTPGYMHSDSPFSLDTSVKNESSFLEWYPDGEATLSYPNTDGSIQSIPKINLFMIESRSQLLASAFEHSRAGPKLHLESLTATTAYPFLRYLYTGSYAVTSAAGDCFEDVPTSVLLHCQLYRLADIYDLTELRSQAYVNVLRQCEFACSSPSKPIELCAAIQYVYAHLSEHENLVDALINYCVSCFERHRLAEDEGFQKLAYELRPFHQALCRNSMNREFENETAAAIIRLPFQPYKPDTYASNDEPGPRGQDVIYHFHGNDDFQASPKKRKRVETAPVAQQSLLTLAIREREVKEEPVAEESASEDDGFTLVPKRRAQSSVRAESEDEYEIVAGPGSVEEATDSEAELLENAQAPAAPRIDLSIRTRPEAAREEAAANDSDSDWDVV